MLRDSANNQAQTPFFPQQKSGKISQHKPERHYPVIF